MARIAIIGAGIAGLLAGHGLRKLGHEVTLWSERSPEDFLARAHPTGTAARFPSSLDFERSLDLDAWSQLAPPIAGIHLTFCPKPGNRLLTMLGNLSRPAMAIDVRLQSATWMSALEARGGTVHIERVDLPRLDEIAARHDLTLVAAGRSELTRIFSRDEAKSTWTAPQRKLTMVNVFGPSHTFPEAPHMRPVKFNLFATLGECFWVPWYSKDGHAGWSLLFEAKSGGPLDRFEGLRSAEAVLARGKELIREYMPWDADWVESAEPCDENAWLVGTFTPEVRDVVGTLPSGRAVMAIGDTAHSLDPIGGQGANNGNKMVQALVAAVSERPDGPYNADWMRSVHARFWARHAAIERFNNALLRPLTTAGKLLLISQYGSSGRLDDDSPQQRLANAVTENFNDPALLTDAFEDVGAAKAALRGTFGSVLPPFLRGGLGVAGAQLRQALGRPPGHPGT